LNQASPISIRLHSLHLLKGIGPKSLDIILKERKLVPFTSFEDFEERTKIKDITTLIKQRIIDEITSDEEKHRLFTRPMPKERY
jgi:putative nucleotide binding protein